MQSRSDQVQAQSYLAGRLVRALVAADPDLLESPTRRAVTGNLAGLLIAGLILAGVGIYGFVRPGGASPSPGSLIVAKETGSRYVLDTTNRLIPITNLASARLILGPKAEVQTVSAKSLSGFPHGEPIGIPGAPEALPPAGSAATMSWTACALDGEVTGTPGRAAVAVDASATPVAGQVLDGRTALIATTGAGDRYLIWSGLRYRLTETWMSRALGFDDTMIVTTTGSWLSLLPVGSDIKPIRPARMGGTGPNVGNAKGAIGQLYRVTGADRADDRQYMLTSSGITQLTQVAAALLLGDPERTRQGLSPESATMTIASFTAMSASEAALVPADLPADVPDPARVPTGRHPCIRYSPEASTPQVLIAPLSETARPPAGAPWLRTSTDGAALISIAANGGGLVVSSWPWQAPGTALSLVTDSGVRYPVPSSAAATALGYASAHRVPPPLLNLLPTGPALDPAALAGTG